MLKKFGTLLSVAFLLACGQPATHPTSANSTPDGGTPMAARGGESVDRGAARGSKRNLEFRPTRCAVGANLSTTMSSLTASMFTPEDGTLQHYAAIDAVTLAGWQSSAIYVSPDDQLEVEAAADSIWQSIETNIPQVTIQEWRGTSLAVGDRCEEFYDKCASTCRKLPASA